MVLEEIGKREFFTGMELQAAILLGYSSSCFGKIFTNVNVVFICRPHTTLVVLGSRYSWNTRRNSAENRAVSGTWVVDIIVWIPTWLEIVCIWKKGMPEVIVLTERST